MKRRLCAVLLLAVAAVFAVCTFSACDGNITGSQNVAALQTDKRYILPSSVKKDADKQYYYLFHSDGTGEYRKYYISSSGSLYNQVYTVKFKYTYADNDKSAVVCFYDSVEYGAENGPDGKVSTTWTQLLTVSKNVLCSAGSYGYSYFINEDYLTTIPNFG